MRDAYVHVVSYPPVQTKEIFFISFVFNESVFLMVYVHMCYDLRRSVLAFHQWCVLVMIQI